MNEQTEFKRVQPGLNLLQIHGRGGVLEQIIKKKRSMIHVARAFLHFMLGKNDYLLS